MKTTIGHDRLPSEEIPRDEIDWAIPRDLYAAGLWDRIDDRKALDRVQRKASGQAFRRGLRIAGGISLAAAAVLALFLLVAPPEEAHDPIIERKVCIAVPEAAIRIIDADGNEQLLSDLNPEVDVTGGNTITKNGGMLSIRAKDGSVARPEAESRKTTIVIPRGAEYQLALSDGSKVWLSAESSLVFPERFTGGTREVEMSGEASFEVAKDPAHPFIVHAGDITLRVLGTTFTVYAYPEDRSIVTTLIEGSVMQSIGATGQQLRLSPSQQTRYFKNDGYLTVSEVDGEDFKAYRQGRIVFRDVPLGEIMLSLARTFDYQIHFQREELRHELYNLIVDKGQRIEEPLEKLISTGTFSYEKRDGHIRIF